MRSFPEPPPEYQDGYGDPGGAQAQEQTALGPLAGLPPTLTQQQIEFLDLPDEVPDELRERLWGLFTRHSELSNIFDIQELYRARRRVRLICRPMMWNNSCIGREGDITFLDRMQIEHFVDLLLRKSYKQQERRLLAPWLQELTQRAEYNESQRHKPQGFINRGMNMIFGGRH